MKESDIYLIVYISVSYRTYKIINEYLGRNIIATSTLRQVMIKSFNY